LKLIMLNIVRKVHSMDQMVVFICVSSTLYVRSWSSGSFYFFFVCGK
jgi:hypothetical protein